MGMAELTKIASVVRPDDEDNMCLGVALGGEKTDRNNLRRNAN